MKYHKSINPIKTAAELMAELQNDPEYVASLKRQAEQRQQAIEHNVRLTTPVIAELIAAGFQVATIADLFNQKMNYEMAIPILLSWLPRIDNPDVKQEIIRALSVPWAKPTASPFLLHEFRETTDRSSTGMRWTIANALSVVADDSVIEEVVQLAKDHKYGKAREMLVLALGNMRNPHVVGVLVDFLCDEEVAGHAIMALGKLRASKVRPQIEEMLFHPKKWIRREAKKALARIDASSRGRTE
jgi:hypothetical protein